jgi:hypothetical protein
VTISNRAGFGCNDVAREHALFNCDIETLAGVVRDQLCYAPPVSANDPRRRHWHSPAGPWVDCLEAVKISLGAIALGVVLNAEFTNLFVHRRGYTALLFSNPLTRRGVSANYVERSPGQHGGYWIEVARDYITAYPGCLKRNTAATTKWVSKNRPVPKAGDAELLYQLR